MKADKMVINVNVGNDRKKIKIVFKVYVRSTPKNIDVIGINMMLGTTKEKNIAMHLAKNIISSA
jgi:hypothetical protein